MPTPTPQHIIEQARALIAQGKSDTDIAQALGIGRATAHRIRKRDPADDATLGQRGGRKKEPSEAEAAGEDATEEVDELGWTKEEAAREGQRHDEHEAAQAKASDAARQEHIQAAHEKIKAKLAERRAKRGAEVAAPRYDDVFIQGVGWLDGEVDPPCDWVITSNDDRAEWGLLTTSLFAEKITCGSFDLENDLPRKILVGLNAQEAREEYERFMGTEMSNLRAKKETDEEIEESNRQAHLDSFNLNLKTAKQEKQLAALTAEVARLERERIDLKRQAIEAETAHTYALTAAEDATRAAQREVEELRAQLAAAEELLYVYRGSLVIRGSGSRWYVDYPSNYSCHTSAQDAVLEAAIKLEVDLGLEVDRLRSQLAAAEEDNARLRAEVEEAKKPPTSLLEALVEAKRQRDVAHMLHVAARRVIAELEGVERARKEMDAASQRLETSREALRNLEVVL